MAYPLDGRPDIKMKNRLGEAMSVNETINENRSHTITWEDPRVSARDAHAISGLDYMLGIKDGTTRRPPVAELIGYRISEVDIGHAVFVLEPKEHHYNPFSIVHGGIASTLLDTTMAGAVLSTVSMGFSCSTAEFKVNFIRPITETVKMLQCKANTIHVGKNLATAEGRLLDPDGKLFSHAVGTFMIFKVPEQIMDS